MADLDFSGLRGEVEAATRLPGFDAVERRGRRVRALARLKAALTVCAAAAVVAPLSMLGLNLHRSTMPAFLGLPPVVQQSPPEPTPTQPGAPVTTMYDVAGV